MDAYVDRAMDDVRRLARSYERLLRGYPTPDTALQNTQAAYAQLITTLTRPELQQRLNAALPAARAELQLAHARIAHTFLTHRDDLLTQESRILRRLPLGRDDLDHMVRLFLRAETRREDESPSVIGGADQVRAMFELLHAEVIARLTRLRALPRAGKKQEKKRLRSAIWSLAFGAGAVIGNLHLPEVFVFSFALGASAIYHGTRELIADGR